MLDRTAYLPLDSASLPARLGTRAELLDRLGPPALWQVREVGDGNLNLVFIVEGPKGSVVVKQALPYARVVGESWPMSLDRAFFEHEALKRLGTRDPGRAPQLIFFDPAQAILAMEHLTPHKVARRAFMEGEELPLMGEHLGLYLARTLFRGSDWSMPTAARKADLALFAGNVELAGITEELVFSDPFKPAPLNRWTCGLEDAAAAVRDDRALKFAAQEMKARFCTCTETLLHGDLHTGSVMATADDTRVIDAEFALYGPMGFDVGVLVANLWMAVFAQPGHRAGGRAQRAYGDFLLATVETLWRVFAAEFSRLWRTERTGILGGRDLFEAQGDTLGAAAALAHHLEQVWQDALGFAGIEICRRILGLAHIAEFETIADVALRARLERRALAFGRHLAVNRRDIPSIDAANRLVRTREEQP
ncbi:S-methyl-5-thioribose kinase [Xanthobacter autotrophicus DSM 431]|uniref:S-methyl-5-thioribose kinase n=1 Tax=Xanthobacter nonsaccharivorans TaxID=3119912 RepID=UPI00372BD379